MRDIGKYRGKRKDNGEWVYGSYFKGDLAWIIQLPFKFVEVIPDTVGESIRRKDKNGKMIYEGDKWRSPGGKTYLVKYGESRPYELGEVVG